jgi:arsenate reductase
MKEECLICSAPLKYLEKETLMECAICHKKDGANESCPNFIGKVGKRLHIGFDDPSDATGSDGFVMNEFRRVRDEILEKFKEIFL